MEDWQRVETNTNIQSNIFSRLAFALSLLNIALVAGTFIIMSQLRWGNLYIISMVLARTAKLGIVAGTLVSIMSLAKKEKLQYLKGIGIAINFLLFVLMIASILFAVIMNYKYGR